jgi:predicted ATPase
VDLLDLAERVGKNAFLMEAHRMVDESAFYMGEFGRARRHLQQSLALYDPQKHRSHAEIYGQDPGVALLSHGCCIMWQAGYPQQALHYGQEAVALAQRQDHPFSLGFALCYSAMMHQYRREPSEVLNLTNAAIKLSRDQGFVIWMAQATFLQGWAVAEQGRIEEGISKMAQGLSDWQASGTEFLSAYLTALLATAHVKNGRIDEALDLLAESFAAVSEKSQGFYEAELHRLKGEFLLQQGSSSVEVEELYQQAIKIAQQRQALSQELRAAISLSRLWQSQGKSAEAYAALSTTYGRFEEGFDTADLLEAKDLLHKLAGS